MAAGGPIEESRSRHPWWWVAAGLLALLLLAGLIVLWIKAPDLYGKGDGAKQATAATRAGILTVAAALIAATAAGAALYFTAWTVRVNQQTLVETQRANREADRRERYAKGAELLGHERAATRIAGVYALARLADDAEDFERRQQSIDALCAYLRLPYTPGPNASVETRAEHTVRSTTLRVIRDHLREDMAQTSWDEHKFNLAGAVFDGGDLAKIRLTGGHITFHDATFAPGVFTFSQAEFHDGARIWFSRARFAGGDIHFHDVLFDGRRVSFDGAHFDSGVVSFQGAKNPNNIVTFDNVSYGGASLTWGPFTPPTPPPSSSPSLRGRVAASVKVLCRRAVAVSTKGFSSSRVRPR